MSACYSGSQSITASVLLSSQTAGEKGQSTARHFKPIAEHASVIIFYAAPRAFSAFRCNGVKTMCRVSVLLDRRIHNMYDCVYLLLTHIYIYIQRRLENKKKNILKTMATVNISVSMRGVSKYRMPGTFKEKIRLAILAANICAKRKPFTAEYAGCRRNNLHSYYTFIVQSLCESNSCGVHTVAILRKIKRNYGQVFTGRCSRSTGI